MANLSINLLGSYRVTLNDDPITTFESDKVRALLAYLAVEADRPHRREKLAGLLWPDWPEASARQNLSHALYNLREALGDREAERPFLIVTRQTLGFSSEGEAWVDAVAFRNLVAQCQSHDHPRLEACDECTERLQEAVALYEGSFLEGFSLPDSAPFEEWARSTREELERLALQALHDLSACYEAHGELDAALAQARRAVELDPCWEQGQRDLMRLLALSGQTSAALAQYEGFERLLENELGVEPSQETRELHELLLQGRRPPGIPAAITVAERKPRPVGACPYRGLATFREEDAPFFYGREAFVERLAEAVERRPVVAVIVGSSGSGKSSAVFAGLLPRLRSERGWLVAQLRPGGHPFEATAAALLPLLEPEMTRTDRLIETQKLAEALRGGQVALLDVAGEVLDQHPEARRLLLVVDQFEELYTLCPDTALQRSFVDLLLAAAEAGGERRISPLALLLTLRADFMGQALAHRPFADALQDGSVIMGPMTRNELQEAIEKPAEAQGAAFEAGLVERILDDVGNEPGNLPLLEFALTLLWENHEHGWLTHAGYEGIGRVEGALARYADQVYGELDEGEREQARRILIQLVRPGEGTEDTRRMATRAELGDQHWNLVGHLADRRLVVTGRDRATGQETVEVVHEALIQRWGQMRSWMDEDRAFRTWQERLRAALRGWEASGRDEGALLRGAPLVEAEGWLAKRGGEPSAGEQNYIGASVALREQQQAERERRREEARRQASVGLAAQALAELEGTSPDRAVLLALEALEHYPYTPQAKSALARAVQKYRPPIALDLAFRTWSPDGALVAATIDTASGPHFAILDGYTGMELRHITVTAPRPCWIYDLFWSRAGDRIAVTTRPTSPDVVCPALTVWDVETGSNLLELAELGYEENVAWSPDGTALLTGGDEGHVRVWDSDSGAMRVAVIAHTGRIQEMALSPAGDQLATASLDGTARVWDVPTLLAHQPTEAPVSGSESGAELLTLTGHAGSINSVAWSPAGDRLATASEDGTVRVWQISQDDGVGQEEKRPQVLLNLPGHSGPVWSVAWSPDGRHIGTVGADNTVRAWDAADGREVFKQYLGPGWGGARGSTRKATWSPDGKLVLLTDNFSWAWDISGQTLQLVGHSNYVLDARWSPDGTRIATCSYDGTWRIWDGATGEQLLRVKHPASESGPVYFMYLAWSPDGTRVVTTGQHSLVEVWDAATGERLFTVARPPDHITCTPNWSPDGGRIAVASWPGDVVLVFDAASGEILTTFGGKNCMLFEPSWSPDGRYLATGCSYGDQQVYPDGNTPARIWDATTGELLLAVESDDVLSLRALWSPDGERLAIAHDYLDMAFVPPSEGGRTAQIWRISPNTAGAGLSAERLLIYAGHTDGIGDIRWSPDGRLIASADRDGMVRVWDPVTGDDVYSFQVPGTVFSVDWSPDGSHLVASGRFDTPEVMRVWSSTEELIDHAYECCVRRQLTAEERVQLGLPAAENH